MNHNWEHSQRKFFSHLKQVKRGKKSSPWRAFTYPWRERVCPSRASAIWREHRGSAPAPVCFQPSRILGYPVLSQLGSLGWTRWMHPFVVLLVDEHLGTGGTSSHWWGWCSLCLIQKRQENVFLSACTRGHTRKGHFRQKETWSCAEGCAGFRVPALQALWGRGQRTECCGLWGVHHSKVGLPVVFALPDFCCEIIAQQRSPELFCRSALEGCFFPYVCSWVYFPSGVEIIILLVSYVLAPAKSRNVLRFFYVVVVVFFFFSLYSFCC